MPLKAINSPNACVVRQDSIALWRSRSARRLVRWMSTVASTTTQMLCGRIVAAGGVAVAACARVHSSPWEDARKMVAPVWCSTWRPSARRVMRTEAQLLRHGRPPLKALHQRGLTMGKMSVHGEPKFSEGQPRVFTNLVRVKTLHELHHGPGKVKILVEAISVKDAKGYIPYTKAK